MIDGIYQNPYCYNLKDLTVGGLCEIGVFESWVIDGDRQVITYNGFYPMTVERFARGMQEFAKAVGVKAKEII